MNYRVIANTWLVEAEELGLSPDSSEYYIRENYGFQFDPYLLDVMIKYVRYMRHDNSISEYEYEDILYYFDQLIYN